jgi:hypothetical protein
MGNWCYVNNPKAVGMDLILRSCSYGEFATIKYSESQGVYYTPVESEHVYFPPMDVQEDIIYKNDLRNSINRSRDIRKASPVQDQSNRDLFNRKRLNRKQKEYNKSMATAFSDAVETHQKRSKHSKASLRR